MNLWDLMQWSQANSGSEADAVLAQKPQGWQGYLDQAREQLVKVVPPGQSFSRSQQDFGSGYGGSQLEGLPAQQMNPNALFALMQLLQRPQQQPYMMPGL